MYVGGISLEQMERDPLSALRAYARQPSQLVDEVLDHTLVQLGYRLSLAVLVSTVSVSEAELERRLAAAGGTGAAEAARERAHRLTGELVGLALGLAVGGDDHGT